MSGEIRCPKCGSKDVTCSENPHNHVCHACGYSMLPTGDVGALDDELVEAVAAALRGWRSTPWRHDPTTIQAIVHLYPEVASMLRDGKG